MRRLVPIAAFALFFALPLWAQHGGGHAGGHGGGSVGHGGFSGGHSGGFVGHSGFSSGRTSGSMHSAPGVSRGFTRVPSSRARFSGGPFLHDRFRGRRIRTFGLRNNCYGYACRGFGYPWAYGGYYDPWWWWDSGSSYDEDYERDRSIASDMNQQSIEEQRMRRQEEADGDQDLYAHSAPAPRPADDQAVATPATVLIFRDQHKQEIRNYAIVGQTLWNFATPRTEKIPLADLDVAATIKANDERGLTFRVPASGEAQ